MRTPIPHDLLLKIVRFYSPSQFKAESTSFDMGYEQCKRDLRAVMRKHIPELEDIESVDAPQVQPEHGTSAEGGRTSWWAKFGRR